VLTSIALTLVLVFSKVSGHSRLPILRLKFVCLHRCGAIVRLNHVFVFGGNE
jgi:hypothetical protein